MLDGHENAEKIASGSAGDVLASPKRSREDSSANNIRKEVTGNDGQIKVGCVRNNRGKEPLN